MPAADAAATLLDDGPLAALTFDAAPPHRLRDATPSLWRLRGDAAAPSQGARLDEVLHADDARAVLAARGDTPLRVRILRADGSAARDCLAVHRIDVGGALHRLQLVDADWLSRSGWPAAVDGARLARSLERARAAQRFLQVLQHVTELLQACDGVVAAGRVVADAGPRLFPGWDGALTQADAAGAMTPLAAWGDAARVAADAPAREDDCWAVRLRRPYAGGARATPAARAPRCAHFGGNGAAADGSPAPAAAVHTLCVPLPADAERAAALHLATRSDVDEAERRTIAWSAEALAGTLGLTLANLRLRESLREQALRDALTGLFNRRHFDDALHHESSRAERTGEPLTLALLDIDHFKAYNDEHGHEAGDAVLRAVAAQLQRFGRAYDVACRIGGEELAVLMPRAALAEARARLEQLRARVAAQPVQHRGAALPPVTVSIGIAALAQPPGTRADLLRRADVALYAAKHGGRDRVAVWSEVMDDP